MRTNYVLALYDTRPAPKLHPNFAQMVTIMSGSARPHSLYCGIVSIHLKHFRIPAVAWTSYINMPTYSPSLFQYDSSDRRPRALFQDRAFGCPYACICDRVDLNIQQIPFAVSSPGPSTCHYRKKLGRRQNIMKPTAEMSLERNDHRATHG